ncbi:MAG: retropepsin-like aspartic protease [Pseudomonadota bacterium]
MVSIANQDALALFDSGSAISTIGRTMATSTGLHIKSVDQGYEAVEGVSVTLKSGSIKFPLVPILDGLGGVQFVIGQELFSQAVVDIDFDAQRLTLIKPEAFVAPDSSPMPVKLVYSRPTVQLQVNGGKSGICAIIDTGFNSGIALTPELAKEFALATDQGQTTIVQGIDGRPRSVPLIAPLDKVQFGGRTLRNVPAVGAVPSEERHCPNLVGMAVLSSYHVIFDLKRERIWLLPRSGSRYPGVRSHSPAQGPHHAVAVSRVQR